MTSTPLFPRRRESRVFLPLLIVALFVGCATRQTVEHYPTPSDAAGKLPFSEAVRAGDLVFASGMIGLQPGTLKVVPGGIQAETKVTLETIRDTFARHGVSMDRVVKCTVFLADMKEWPAMNEVYVQFFPGGKPARSALGANGLALGARVEIECIGVR